MPSDPRCVQSSQRLHRLFIDTAETAALQHWLPSGLLYGVTTNPSILQRAGVPCEIDAIEALARVAFASGAREFQAQAWGGSADKYASTGRLIANISADVVVKLPLNEAGLRAAHTLLGDGVRVTMTAVYSVAQALTAAALGVDYVAPYHGRLGDDGRDADAIVAAVLNVMRDMPAEQRTRVLVASIRSADIAGALAAAGCDTLTVSPQVLEQMIDRADSAGAIDAFERHARGE